MQLLVKACQFVYNSGIEVFIALFLSNAIAQWIKIIAYIYKKRKFNLALLFATGGMPSSHTSTAVSMATTVGIIEGFGSVAYAISFCVAAIVMVDAAGVRRAASKQAIVLNRLIHELILEESELKKEKLKELLGHTPKQVLAGAILGILVSYGLHYGIELILANYS